MPQPLAVKLTRLKSPTPTAKNASVAGITRFTLARTLTIPPSASVALRPSPKSKAAATLPLRAPIADGGLAQHRVALADSHHRRHTCRGPGHQARHRKIHLGRLSACRHPGRP